jgi:tRNA/rRNA methyltransferase
MTAPSIILARPQLGENIGAAARAMANFDLSDFRLVAPRTTWPSEKARAMAVGAAYIVDGAKVFGDLKEALGDLQFVLATTARGRGAKKWRRACAAEYCSATSARGLRTMRCRSPTPS